MTRFAIAFCCVLGLLPQVSRAGTSLFAYCSVHDVGGHDIWASQVFELPMPDGPEKWTAELNRIETEFHGHVGKLGGAGDKSCPFGSTLQAMEAQRAETAAALTKRFLGVRLNKWHNVNWTPSARPADELLASNAPAPKFFFCWDANTETRKLVWTNVFSVTMPPLGSEAHAAETTRLQREFSEHLVATHGFTKGAGICIEKDTHAEAQKSLSDTRKQFRLTGANQVVESWQPSASPVTTSTKATAPPAHVAPAKPAVPIT
jgi:hypothetical protein